MNLVTPGTYTLSTSRIIDSGALWAQPGPSAVGTSGTILDVLHLDSLRQILSIGVRRDSPASVERVKVVERKLPVLGESVDEEGGALGDLLPTLV